MASELPLTNRVKTCRAARGWSQDELASRAGISRAGVSAIETNRLAPSTSAALALAAALDCRVEDLFQLAGAATGVASWAWPPQRDGCRYWRATTAKGELLYPVEATDLGAIAHDGVCRQGQLREQSAAAPADTLVLATCDPAVGLLAGEFSRRSGFRLLAFPRSSRKALDLLSQGLVHAAGIHLASVGRQEQNAAAAREKLQGDFCMLGGARWQAGLALAPGLHLQSVRAAANSRARWVAREVGSAARELLDELLSGRQPPRRVAYGHRAVAEAIRCGWADVGVCLQLVSDEAGLDFLSVREEQYDYCYPAELQEDPRIRALVDTVRSSAFRGLLGDLPGYDAAATGELQRIA